MYFSWNKTKFLFLGISLFLKKKCSIKYVAVLLIYYVNMLLILWKMSPNIFFTYSGSIIQQIQQNYSF